MALTGEGLSQIRRIVTEATAGLASKKDLDRMATKVDLDRMESRLTTSINLLQRAAFTRLDEHEARITNLEKSISA